MIRVGFEFEFVTSLEKKEIRDAFTEFTGERITGQHFSNQTSGKHWVLTLDPSCVVKYDYEAGYEIISPVFELGDCWVVLETMFKFIDHIGAQTKMSTGVHINIDIGPDTQELDPVELVLLMDEEELLDKYDRKYNKYCVPYINKIKARLSKYKRYYTYTEIKEKIYAGVVERGKWQTVNFMNLKTRGYVEFRVVGGIDYHHRLDDIWHTLLHFVDCVIESTYNTKEKVIIKKLNKILKVKI